MTIGHSTPSAGVQVPDGIFIPGGLPYRHDLGQTILGMLNRIKTTPDDFANANGFNLLTFSDILAGHEDPSDALLIAIEQTSPLNVRELIDPRYAHRVPIHDDSVDGVVICTGEESAARTRVYRRGKGKGVKFYTYYHTAVQRSSSIIPEKIVEHYEWDPTDPNLPDEYFNNGHRERQMTVAIGSVNYHWIDAERKKHVIAAHTGDANAISPFTRHSFTVPPGEKGYILAVTDLGAIGTPDFRALAHALDKDEYLALMRKMLPADAPESSFDELGGFMFRRYDDAHHVSHGDGNSQRMLMDDITAHPSFVAYELGLSPAPYGGDPFSQIVNASIWGYVPDTNVVKLEWESHTEILGSGDSFSIQPNVPHSINSIAATGTQVFIMQSNPAEESTLEQLALVHKFRGDEGLLRAMSEDQVWFKEAKKDER